MKLKMIALVATLAATTSVTATIQPGSTGNGELFVSVFDNTAKISYTYDMGVTMDDFFVAAQANAGYDKTWNFNDANFASFLGQVTASNLRWAVLAADSFGPTSAGGQRLFTTVRAGSTAADIASPTNVNFSNGIGSSQLGTFLNDVNQTGTHATQADGSSVNAETDAGRTYFGEAGGTGPSFNSNFATLRLDSAVGESTSFYYLTRSGVAQTGIVLVDQFDNLGTDGSSKKGVFALTGGPAGYKLNYNLQPVPEPGTYALMLAGLGCIGLIARRRQQLR